jgi:hypothetical protein
MSEQIEYFRAIKEFRKEEMAEIGEQNAKIIADLSSELPYYCQNTQNSIRIVGIDISVTTMRGLNKAVDALTTPDEEEPVDED